MSAKTNARGKEGAVSTKKLTQEGDLWQTGETAAVDFPHFFTF
jgi:hypothetical protein